MGDSAEARFGPRIEAALERVRDKVFLMGTAGRWHVGKASDVVRDAALVERYVTPLGEADSADYLRALPELIEQTRTADERCAAAWRVRTPSDNSADFLAGREHLIHLFARFRFRLKVYERLVRRSEKPLLRIAVELLGASHTSTAEVEGLEAVVRMSLAEFVAIEEGLAADLLDADTARERLWAAYEELALGIARSRPDHDAVTTACARAGLQRAANWYDHRPGYSFAEYARPWIQRAVDERRG
ncbi:MAG TPA: hypothetical protein VH092_23130 [Urbifossiella sp.]|jgi:hypothetical protein|nr:hypothetical protein [Urbifossiella sp.]